MYKPKIYNVTQEIIQKVQRQSRKKTACNINLCSYKLSPLPPKQKMSGYSNAATRCRRSSICDNKYLP